MPLDGRLQKQTWDGQATECMSFVFGVLKGLYFAIFGFVFHQLILNPAQVHPGISGTFRLEYKSKFIGIPTAENILA